MFPSRELQNLIEVPINMTRDFRQRSIHRNRKIIGCLTPVHADFPDVGLSKNGVEGVWAQE